MSFYLCVNKQHRSINVLNAFKIILEYSIFSKLRLKIRIIRFESKV